ncbi:hypothetical protein GCM10008018_69580 [Paenibacillus marchantiophytorum]|uniref:Uncharacterized protein n=1 Tax=Paenibacillus marchantiophytorum TaxID=1619310 RepID=A0ABQ1FJZ2_9BACL|nr:hypothetical protein GCM10008018_69580 [Paenibacillus marchantiophytorum]
MPSDSFLQSPSFTNSNYLALIAGVTFSVSGLAHNLPCLDQESTSALLLLNAVWVYLTVYKKLGQSRVSSLFNLRKTYEGNYSTLFRQIDGIRGQ